jgi:succinate-semialdehyde dehydrogenase/glutarate-semialdehyde dehydrogenase
VTELVADAVEHGAKVLAGGTINDNLGKNFYEATVLTNVNDKMRLWSEEIFGPVAPLFAFASEDEVVRKANDTDVGLAGYVYTQDVARIFRVAKKLETGMVAVNAGVVSIVQAPFGGVKESGIGREGSPEGLDEFQESKMVCLGGLC